MPMLMTLRMRFPRVSPPLAAANLLRENGHPVKHGVHLGHNIDSVNENLFTPGGAQGDVKNSPILRDVDLLAAEHGLNAFTEAALLGEIDEEADRLVRDTILRVVQVKAGTFGGQALAAKGIIGEERPQMHIADLPVMLLQGLPRRLAPSAAASWVVHSWSSSFSSWLSRLSERVAL